MHACICALLVRLRHERFGPSYATHHPTARRMDHGMTKFCTRTTLLRPATASTAAPIKRLHRAHLHMHQPYATSSSCTTTSGYEPTYFFSTARHRPFVAVEGRLQATHHCRHATATPTLHRQGLHQRGLHQHHRRHTAAASSTRWTISVL